MGEGHRIFLEGHRKITLWGADAAEGASRAEQVFFREARDVTSLVNPCSQDTSVAASGR